MRYVCLVYFDPHKAFDQSPESNAVLNASGAYDRELEASGHMVLTEALELPRAAMTVQVRDGKMSATDGPFMETKEVLGGFIVVEARDLNEAVRLAAGIPLAKLGSVEVRPVVDFSLPRPGIVSTTDVREMRALLEAVYQREARRVRATLIRLLGGFDEAEEAVHEAFLAAADRWPREGVPDNPYSWLVSTGRFRTIDRWRRQARLAGALPDLALLVEPVAEPAMPDAVVDDELRLIFTCCHPALPPDARIALTLREVANLTTEEIARAYLVPAPTIGQRIVRAKAKIREAAIPYEVPARAELHARLESALRVVYLIFNEGYSATQGPQLMRADLCAEALRLGRLLVELLPEPEAQGLLALMMLHEARRATRVDAAGDLILLADQDRSLWDRALIAQAQAVIDRAMLARQVGPYLVQAAIAALHAEAPSSAATDWSQIVTLYEVLGRVDPSPVVALNQAVALGMRDGPERGLSAITQVIAQGGLDDYHLAHAARAEMERRLGQVDAARSSYQRALACARQPAEVRFLQARLAGLEPSPSAATPPRRHD